MAVRRRRPRAPTLTGAWPGRRFPLRRRRRRRLLLAVEDLRPVELDLGVVLFDQADRVLVEGRAPDANPGRSAEPVEDPRATLVPAARRVDDVGGLVAALVAAEPKRGQGLLPFLRAGHRLSRPRRAWSRAAFAVALPGAFRVGAAAARDLAAAGRLGVRRRSAGCAGRRGPARLGGRRPVHQGEAGLVADRVEAPDLRDVDAVFGRPGAGRCRRSRPGHRDGTAPGPGRGGPTAPSPRGD